MHNTEINLSELDVMLADLNEVEREHMTDNIMVAALPEREAFAFVTVDQIVGGHNLRKGDNNLTSKKVGRSHEVLEMEREAKAKLREKRRKQIARARIKRAAEQKARDEKPLDPVRLNVAWAIVEQVAIPITKIAVPLYNRFRRVLGDTDTHDIGQNVAIKCAESFARSEHDMAVLAEAALWLKSAPQPYEAADGPEGARVLVGTIVRIARTQIVDTYRSKTQTIEVMDSEGNVTRKDVTMESFELLDAYARSIGADVDTLIARNKADGKPKYASKPPTGLLSRQFARVAIDSFIEAREVGWLADLMMSDEHTRTDNSFRWTEHAGLIFQGFDVPQGELSTQLQAHYAKRMARLAMKDLPDVMLTIRALANEPGFLWDVMKGKLEINALGETGVALTNKIMRGDKPDALRELLDGLARDLDDIEAGPQAKWRRVGRIDLIPGLAKNQQILENGAHIFLEGQEDGELPTRVYQGPDSSERKKILKQEPSQYKCDHGRRTHLVGYTKRPYKWGRVWHGDFCPEKGDNACEPMFRADPNLDKHMLYASHDGATSTDSLV